MKKIILISLFLFMIPILILSEPVSLEEAEQSAETFLESRNIFTQYSIANSVVMEDDNGKILSHIYNLSPQGFVALSADSDIYPVIAYSTKSNHNWENTDDLLVYMLKQDMKLRNQAREQLSPNHILRNQKLWQKYIEHDLGSLNQRDFEQWPSQGSTTTTGWIETTWDQSYPYNIFCPLDPNTGQRCVVGCVATAMSMIIDYHEYVGTVAFNYGDAYTTWGGISIPGDSDELDFPDFDELNVYLDSLNVHYQNDVPRTTEDLAALCFACGITVEMGYSSSGSGAWTAMVASGLISKFGFDSAEWVESNQGNFYELLIEDMQNAKPTEIAIRHEDGSAGHAINLDGYNTDDFYHLNFGWGSTSPGNIADAWYHMPEGMPSGYSVCTGAVLNIEGGEVPLQITGTVNTGTTSPVGTEITLDGDFNYSLTVENEDGTFNFPAVFPGIYTATALLGRVWFQTQEVTLDAENTVVNFSPFNYESVSGSVELSDGSSPVGTTINFEGDYSYSQTVTDPDGTYEIADVMPGTYTVTANCGRIFFETKEVAIDSTNMTVDFYLHNYTGESTLSYYSGDPTSLLDLQGSYTVGCAVRFTSEELDGHAGEIIGTLSIFSPDNSDNCALNLLVFEGGSPDNPPGEIVYNAEIESFSADSWIEHDLTRPVEIQSAMEYWVGYEITTTTGKVGWMDNGPVIADKGLWIKPSDNWISPIGNPGLNGNWFIDMTLFADNSITSSPAPNLNNIVMKNYPNPFSQTTTIEMNLPVGLQLTNPEISIINVKGQLVRRIAIGNTLNSQSQLSWNGEDTNGNKVSNGIYFFRLQSDNIRSKPHKLILLH